MQSYQLQVITSSLKRIPRLEALEQFNENYDSAKKTLVEMIKALDNKLC
jgi:hypothetical protein